ncbi:CLUMA_CG003585, isoform A [Clunio marinus]|uniref:CLUMA_CG003585, isoform A n=1 Tax=Clunio marinus TaxID=568069 RepID=A0A1J1HNS4_9DIPT|nr:CLUMA_CG003585, isoform A [Clunio marinus]
MMSKVGEKAQKSNTNEIAIGENVIKTYAVKVEMSDVTQFLSFLGLKEIKVNKKTFNDFIMISNHDTLSDL